MSQISTKFVAANAIDDTKIALRNDNPLRSANAATTGYVNILYVDGSDTIQFSSQAQSNFTPANPSDIANKAYVDALGFGISWKQPVAAVATSPLAANTYANGTAGVGATLTATGNGAIAAIDGYTPLLNDRLLISGEATMANNGIYTVTQVGDAGTPYILTRTSDNDTSSEMNAASMFVENGTTFADTAWVQTTVSPVLGTDPVAFVQFSSISYTFGNGLALTGSTVNVVPGDSSLTATAGSLVVAEDAAGAIVTGGSGIKVNLETSNPTLQIASNKLGVKLDAAGAIVTGSGGIKVQFDSNTLAVSTDTLAVHLDAAGALVSSASGIAVQLEGSNPTLQISADALGVKLNAAGAIVTSSTGIKVQTDATTIKVNGSNQLEGYSFNKEDLTLSSGDISAQFKDLAQVVAAKSIQFVVSGVVQTEGVDYTVSLTGGSGGKTRLSFSGDLGTGGAAALVSGDIIHIQYAYFA